MDSRMLQDCLHHLREISIRQVEMASSSGRGVDPEKELMTKLTSKEQMIRDIDSQLHQALEELAKKSSELTKAEQSEAEAQASLEQEKRRHDNAGEKLTARYKDLERSKDDLEERMRQVVNIKGQLEAAKEVADSQARESMEAVRRLEEEKQALQAELAAHREQAAQAVARAREEADAGRRGVEQETRDLRCRAAVLEDQLQDAQEKLQHKQLQIDQERQKGERAEQRAQRAEQEQERLQQQLQHDVSQWSYHSEAATREKLSSDLAAKDKMNSDLKAEVCRLQRLLHQERTQHGVFNPTDHLALCKKAQEEFGLAAEVERLQRELMETQCDLGNAIGKISELQQKEAASASVLQDASR